MYLTITGADGSGKDTVVSEVLKRLNDPNILVFGEPGGTPNSELLRKIILTSEDNARLSMFENLDKGNFEEVSCNYIDYAYKHFLKAMEYEKETGLSSQVELGLMEVYLYAAARNESNIHFIEKYLSKGYTVLGMRSLSCSVAYQGRARGLGKDLVLNINERVMKRYPDLEIHLDLKTEKAMERVSNRVEKQDRLDLESESFHRSTRIGYLDYYVDAPYPVHIIDASGTVEENTNSVIEALEKYNQKTLLV